MKIFAGAAGVRRRALGRVVRAVAERLESRVLLAGQFFYVNDNWHNVSGPGAPGAGDTVDNSGAGDDGALHGLTYGSNAFGGIAAALAAAGGGDTVVIVSGSYGSGFGATVTAGVTLEGWESFARLHALPAANPDAGHLTQSALNGALATTLSGVQFTIADAAAENVTVMGFRMAGYGAGGGVTLGSANQATVTIAGNVFSNSSAATAIVVDGGAAIVSGNSISGTGIGVLIRAGGAMVTGNHLTLGLNANGIVVAGGQLSTITQNVIDHTVFFGFAGVLVTGNGSLFGGANLSSSAVITGNHISGAQYGIGLDGSGADAATAVIANNTLTGLATGIFVQGASAVATISTNLISTVGIGIDAYGGNAFIDANVIHGSTTGILLENGASGTLIGNRFNTGTPNATDLEIADVTTLLFSGGNRFGASDTFISNESPVDFTLTHEQFGTRDAGVLASKIFDQVDDPGFGLITISLQLSVESAALSGSVIHAADVLTLSGSYADQGVDDPHQIHVNWGDGSSPQTVSVSGGVFLVQHLYTAAGTDSISAYVTAVDGATSSTFTGPVTVLPGEVVGRRLFYGGSIFDAGEHDNAIAPDKAALLPGGAAGSANYSSYTSGINGLMIDLTGTVTGLTLNDFQFAVGNDDLPANWSAPGSSPTLNIRHGAGTGGSTRVEFTFADGVIAGAWLQVTVKATGHTGLAAADVFYFGNAPAEAGDSAVDAKVNAGDQLSPRFGATPNAAITHPFDYNRDGVVDGLDETAARQHFTYFLNELRLIHPPAGGGAAPSVPANQPSASPAPSIPIFPRVGLVTKQRWQFQMQAASAPEVKPVQLKVGGMSKLRFAVRLPRRAR